MKLKQIIFTEHVEIPGPRKPGESATIIAIRLPEKGFDVQLIGPGLRIQRDGCEEFALIPWTNVRYCIGVGAAERGGNR